ncbi:DoxX family protein [Methylovirgula sp. 4M-Z18]|uniref:DoxX family protein n=1 Tax=Methylovirgula sp. 4M-Z18 TaxID=2293567 RepID=UPI000E2EBA3E|nr:DoxX family protein [Methylovirgula sp. 4M-Z18]RFB81123.1 DoxX family protein [Methylovirgula sp. 4M-Z18]
MLDQRTSTSIVSLHSVLMLLARILLAPAFLYSGVDKLVHWSAGQQEIAASGLPMVTVLHIVTVAIQLGAGLSVLLGIQARLGALMLCALLVPVTVLYHPFWQFSGTNFVEELNHFLSNLGLIGGFLMVLIFGAGPLSVEDRPLTRETLHHFLALAKHHGVPGKDSA